MYPSTWNLVIPLKGIVPLSRTSWPLLATSNHGFNRKGVEIPVSQGLEKAPSQWSRHLLSGRRDGDGYTPVACETTRLLIEMTRVAAKPAIGYVVMGQGSYRPTLFINTQRRSIVCSLWSIKWRIKTSLAQKKWRRKWWYNFAYIPWRESWSEVVVNSRIDSQV